MAQVTLTRPVVDAGGHETLFTTTLTIPDGTGLGHSPLGAAPLGGA